MIQTFVLDETKELIYDSDSIDEWKAKCQELGLENQLTLAQEGKSPIPFAFMNQVTKRVYETLCPMKVELIKYSKTPIPLEVLGLIQLSQREKYFKSIEIWYDDRSPDPLAVGRVQKDNYTWNDNFYLLARWGDVLRPFEELKRMAIKVFTESKRIELSRNIVRLESELKTLDVDVMAHFDVQHTMSAPSDLIF